MIESILRRKKDTGIEPIELTPGAIRILKQFSWPGNIRELENLLERLAVLYPGATVDIPNLPMRYTSNVPFRTSDRREVAEARVSGPLPQDFESPGGSIPLKAYLENMEISLIRRALHEADGVVARAARNLQVRRTTLAEKMKRHNIEWPRPQAG